MIGTRNKMKIKYLLLALRPKQWVKNLFIFSPLIFGGKLFIYPANLKTAIAFVLFCLAASVVYLANDLIDLEKDKLHPKKRLRPIASGKVTVDQTKIAALILGIISIVLSFMLSGSFGWVVVTYLTFNLLYSKILKEAVIIDVFCIAAFFLLRIIAGAVVAEVSMSYWIVIMTALLALFLGFNKRRQEVVTLEEKAASHRKVLIKYDPYFIDQMIAVITSSIVVVYMLYTVDANTVREFGSNHLIYTIPFVYYGIFRYLYLIHRRNEDGDPTDILISDRKTQLNIVLWAAVCILVLYYGV